MPRAWRLAVVLALTACEQPPPQQQPPPRQQPVVLPPAPASVAQETAAPAAPATRPERAPAPPRQEGDVWIYESIGPFLDAYLGGTDLGPVRVSGQVSAVVDLGEAGGTRLMLGPDARRFVELRFQDGGAEVLRKRLARGSLVTAQCTPQSRVGQNALLVGCALR